MKILARYTIAKFLCPKEMNEVGNVETWWVNSHKLKQCWTNFNYFTVKIKETQTVSGQLVSRFNAYSSSSGPITNLFIFNNYDIKFSINESKLTRKDTIKS